ncbi:hypothetical protein EPI10_020896 [Gossypium australe]|uniref:Uncharacterized protein n=1 Tax=Gossypium australe TaxID=47621 RepID=A0A5B6WFU8_9ROSI|nr:hypothetical protein EPI10_020896 [Gossypium australe]
MVQVHNLIIIILHGEIIPIFSGIIKGRVQVIPTCLLVQIIFQVNRCKNLSQTTNELKNRPQGALPSDTENPRRTGKAQCKTITLRSGKNLVHVTPTGVQPQQSGFEESTPMMNAKSTLPPKRCPVKAKTLPPPYSQGF